MTPIIGADYPKIVIPLIEAAKHSIDIVVYDWRWYEAQGGHPVQQFNMALVRATRRGVRIRAIVNTPLILAKLRSVGIKACQIRDKRTLHAKLLIIDSSLLVMGSHNFTRNAFCTNLETSVTLTDVGCLARFNVFFERLYNFV